MNNPITFINANLSALKKYLDKIFRLNKLYEDMADSAKNVGADYMPDVLQSIDAFKRDNKTVFIMGDIETLMDETISGVDRIKNIIQELKIFSRKDDADFKIADVNEIIMGTLKIVGSQLKQKATVTMDLQPLPKVHCFPIKISQVLINLLINASQAIEQNGDIGILTDLVTDGRKNIAEFVRIRVTDTGMGIPESHMASLFDPFFTTKQVGVGTGLGLSVAYEIIASHNGQIQVDSKMDQGSCFTILLPIHNNDAIRMN
ncbi:MAG: ATP-binding protein [Desulfobacterales bacterium]|nr:ATP-binding protein [Desulfobacterales bacterium]